VVSAAAVHLEAELLAMEVGLQQTHKLGGMLSLSHRAVGVMAVALAWVMDSARYNISMVCMSLSVQW